MIRKWNVTIPPLTGWKKRKAYVYVPDSFEENRDLRYPVLYMFDGQNLFFDDEATYGKSWGLLDYIEHTQTQLMVVAVECNTSPGNGRLKEYSPYSFYDNVFGYVKGKGKITMKWFINYLKPFIDEHYPTIPDREFTFIGGSSMGGLMSLYALFAHNDVFSGAISMSPSVWVDPEKIKALVENAEVDPVTDLYIDCGEEEFKHFEEYHESFYQLVDTIHRKGICTTARRIPNGVHSEASWEKQLPFAISSIMYRVDRLEEQLAAEYEKPFEEYDEREFSFEQYE